VAGLYFRPDPHGHGSLRPTPLIRPPVFIASVR
jgi:hypothetical protein